MRHNIKIDDIELKPIRFVGSAAADLRLMPKTVKVKIGQDLQYVQAGETPESAKPLKGFAGVMEIVARFDKDTYRSVYTVEIKGVVYVLHCFKKKSKHGIKTPKEDIDLIRNRLQQARRDSERD